MPPHAGRQTSAALKQLLSDRVTELVNLLRLGLSLRKTASRALVALLDGRVPPRLKLMALGAVLFVLSPLNLLGDIPLLGVLDDAALIGLVLVWFTRASRPYMNTLDARPIARR